MKKIFLPLMALLFSAVAGFCQHYSCISSLEHKAYYTNNIYCLIGMRIDSVRGINDTSTFYPYKTGRINTSLSLNNTIDPDGGSWLGRKIIELPDHSTHIPTKWNNSFLIKNDAVIGQSWVAYSDSTDIKFIAKVISIESTSFANITDSVKTISIQAVQGSNTLIADSLNGMTFSLSMHHGLVKAFPFYFFPFYNHHQNNFDFNYDYYLNNYDGYTSIKNGFTFNRVDYKPILAKQIFSYTPGDILISQEMVNNPLHLYNTESDTIMNMQQVNGAITYEVNYHRRDVSYNGQPGGPTIRDYSGSKTISYESFVMTDTSKMPEEFENSTIQYYIPGDSTFCFESTLYKFETTPMASAKFNIGWSKNRYSYKDGMGMIQYTIRNMPSDTVAADTFLMGAQKVGIFCGSSQVLAVADVLRNEQVNIYPNPANNFIKIELHDIKGGLRFYITLNDIAGRQMGHWQMKNRSITIPTENIPAGLYFLKLGDENSSLIRKINIVK